MGHLKRNRRAGFTLIELLTVIAIIALMASLLVGASYRFVVGAREAATATTITKASGIIQDRVRGFQEFDFSQVAIELANRLSVPKNLGEILARKAQFKKAFPQAFAELDSAQTTRLFGSLVTYPLQTTLPATSASYDSKYEPGILLYALLMNGQTFGYPTPGDDTFTGAEIKNTAATGNLPCLVDAWGEPLRFYRWPTRLIRCGEQSFGDYNQNGDVELAGFAALPAWSSSVLNFSPPIRPVPGLTSPPGLASTPASLLMLNLPVFDRSNTYAYGPDQCPGVAGVDDDGNGVTDFSSGTTADYNEVGWPCSDDPEPLNIDPDDPSYLLATWFSGSGSPMKFVYGSEAVNNVYVDAYHDIYTFHAPLIVSAGQDRQLGLYEPTDIPTTTNPYSLNGGYLASPIASSTTTAAFQYLFDNITNLNIRAGGK